MRIASATLEPDEQAVRVVARGDGGHHAAGVIANFVARGAVRPESAQRLAPLTDRERDAVDTYLTLDRRIGTYLYDPTAIS